MQRYTTQRGAALILLLGITAALAILTMALVMLTVNQQGATARERASKTSMYYAEAALNSAVATVKGTDTWHTAAYSGSAATDAMAINYNTLPAPRPTPTFRVYDDASVVTTSTPAWDANGNLKVWVEAAATYRGRTSRVRQMVATVTQSIVSRFPKAALFSGGAGADDNVYLNSSGDAYAATFASWPATNANGVAYMGGAPFPTSIMARGNITSNGSANLALNSSPQSLGVQANGSISIPSVSGLKKTIGGVPDLNTYFKTSDQLKLQNQARSCLGPDVQAQFAAAKVDHRPAAVTAPIYTTKGALLAACTYNSGTKTYTASTDLAYTSGTTLALNDPGYTYDFKSLTVNGNLALSSTTITNADALRVTGTLAISSTGTANTFGPVYAVGATTISGSSTNTFAALWVDGGLTLSGSGATTTDSLHVGGAFSINSPAITNILGPTYVMGNFDTRPTSTSINKFGPVWVDGTVTLNGSTTTYSTALHVGGDFTISGPTSTNQFGPVYVIGDVNWGGAASVQTTDYTDTTAAPGPMWVGGVFTRNGGPFNDVYGDVFVVFQVNFTPTASGFASTVMCPLLATTEMITTSGNIDFGTMVTDPSHPKPRPMTIYMVCDNDGYYTQTCNWGSTGQFYGLMVLMEAGIKVTTGNSTKPTIIGSILSIGGDGGVTVDGSATVAYSQDVIDAVVGTLVTTTTTTQTIAGTWQQLSPGGN
jgi:Tfp pilus assembly protein PilX